MVREVIALGDEEVKSRQLLPLYDEKLRQYLCTPDTVTALCLRQEFECNTAHLGWLEQWTGRFRKANKTLFLVAATPAQFECLDISHPELGLRYVASMDELDALLPRSPEPAPSMPPPGQPVYNFAAAPQGTPPLAAAPAAHPPPEYRMPMQPPTYMHLQTVVIHHSAPVPAAASVATPLPKPVPPPVDYSLAAPSLHLATGAVVTVSGEYACSACKATRMWLKGDVMAGCENPECRASAAGWHLTAELF